MKRPAKWVVIHRGNTLDRDQEERGFRERAEADAFALKAGGHVAERRNFRRGDYGAWDWDTESVP